MQAVRVSSTAQRDWYHLVGNRADVHIWTADTRSPPLAGCRAYPRELRASERWVQEAIQRALIPDRMAGLELALVLPDYSTSHFALLSGATLKALFVWGFTPLLSLMENVHTYTRSFLCLFLCTYIAYILNT